MGKSIDVYCNDSKTSTNQQGMSGFIRVWYNPAGSANVVSLKTAKSLFRVTYNSDDRDGVFTVHLDKEPMKFIPHSERLHYLDLEKCENREMLMTMTVRDTNGGHAKHEIRKMN